MGKKLEKYIANHIITEWAQSAEQTLTEVKPREIQIEFSKTGAIAIIGVRRCGKTSLALLLAKKTSAANFLYINIIKI